MNCNNCGVILNQNDVFCSNCGAKIVTDKRRFLPVGKIIGLLCINWLFPGLLYFLLYEIIQGFFYGIIENFLGDLLIIKLITSLILQWCILLIIWGKSISNTCKKTRIYKNDVSNIMKGLVIFTFVVCLISVIINFISAQKTFDETINNDPKIQYYERYIELFGSEQDVSNFIEEKNKLISKVKIQLFSQLFVLETAVVFVYLSVLPYVKKDLLSNSE